MNVLHTSDWHLGASLYGRKRYAEFDLFLDWLLQTIQQYQIDVLVVSGDIFDKNVPSNRAQELYYRFLIKVASHGCGHVVIIAGNHDSPTFLDAPKGLLGVLNITVTGSVSENLDEEVNVVSNKNGHPELIVCSVPYLRDRDIRSVEAGESIQDKDDKLINGISNHYKLVSQRAQELQKSFDHHVPILATGHIFTTGAKTVDGDGVRDLYVGSLGRISVEAFPECIDYLALGHIHTPQKVGGNSHIRYCGSPYAIGFGEAKQQKSVILVEFKEGSVETKTIPIPCFQELEQIVGNWKYISDRLEQLKEEGSQAWLEIVYEGQELINDLGGRLDECLIDCGMELLRVKNKRVMEQIINKNHTSETLDDLEVSDVFLRCLESHNFPDDQIKDLINVFDEAVHLVYNADPKGSI